MKTNILLQNWKIVMLVNNIKCNIFFKNITFLAVINIPHYSENLNSAYLDHEYIYMNYNVLQNLTLHFKKVLGPKLKYCLFVASTSLHHFYKFLNNTYLTYSLNIKITRCYGMAT
jgi:hypothetical protein